MVDRDEAKSEKRRSPALPDGLDGLRRCVSGRPCVFSPAVTKRILGRATKGRPYTEMRRCIYKQTPNGS